MIDLESITTQPKIIRTTHQLTRADHWDHFLTRLGYKRSRIVWNPGSMQLETQPPIPLCL